MLTRRPRIFSRRPRLEAVRPLPRLEATPPVTKTCLVKTGRGVSADVANLAPVVSADGRCPSVHGVSEYQERALLTCTDTGSVRPARPDCQVSPVRYGTSGLRLGSAPCCRHRPPGGNVTASGAAISGLGMTSLGRVYGSSPRRLAASAVRLAAADAGMALADIDGLLICPGITGGLDVGLAGVLGLRDLALLAVVNSFGASAATAVQVAAQAVTSGTARAVACVFADTPLREGAPAGTAFGSHGGASGTANSGGPPERHGLAGLAAGYGFRSGSDFGLVTGAVPAGRAAMAMAGIGPADVTMCQIYDCYTYTVLVTLEDYGFCAKGEGGAFAASGALAPGGSLPVN